MALNFVLTEAKSAGKPGVVHVTGSLTLGPRLLEFGKRIGEHLSSGSEPGVILDLGGVHDIDSAGLGELVILYTTAGQHGRRLCLANPSPRIVQLLKITRLSGILPHFAGEGQAEAWLTETGEHLGTATSPNQGI